MKILHGLTRLGGGVLLLAAAVVAAPFSVHAQNTCNASLEIAYVNVPDFNTIGSIDRVQVRIGAGSIQGGTQLTIERIAFGLDCRNKGCSNNFNADCNVDADCGGGNQCLSLLPTCIDDGNVAGYISDATITTTCGVVWTSDTSVANRVVFSASAPIVIPAGTPNFCN
ncbi:MAG TPA: hypothetical protein VEB21_05340, partial [Terriglobales bacterium]|nr:hypothetical protein [Terriglobales bacterium]